MHKLLELALTLTLTTTPHHKPHIPEAPKPIIQQVKPIEPLTQTDLAPQEELTPVEPPAPVVYHPPVASAGNLYVPGNCTWYAKSRRPDLPNDLGNADTWTARAAAYGFATGYIPRSGAIGQFGMHVVYVESVNPDGSFNLSEMNYLGLYKLSGRDSVSPAGWSFIY